MLSMTTCFRLCNSNIKMIRFFPKLFRTNSIVYIEHQTLPIHSVQSPSVTLKREISAYQNVIIYRIKSNAIDLWLLFVVISKMILFYGRDYNGSKMKALTLAALLLKRT